MTPQRLPPEAAAAETTERVRRLWDKRAARYDRGARLAERLLLGDGRAWLCSQARGEVLEVAIGTGRNLPYYPADVRLTGLDLSPAMLEVARRRAAELGRAVDLLGEHMAENDQRLLGPLAAAVGFFGQLQLHVGGDLGHPLDGDGRQADVDLLGEVRDAGWSQAGTRSCP